MLGVKGCDKLVDGNSGLLEHAVQSADLEFSMVRHDATNRTASQDDVATPLARNDKTKPLKRADDVRTRDDRKFRHARELGMRSARRGP